MEKCTENFSNDERELISPAVVSVDSRPGYVSVTVRVRKCFGVPVEETLHFNEETILKMLRITKRSNT